MSRMLVNLQPSQDEASDQPKACNFMKRSFKRNNFRKRTKDQDEDSNEETSVVVVNPQPNQLSQHEELDSEPLCGLTHVTDICEEYQLSGSCAYGDNCDFLHLHDLGVRAKKKAVVMMGDSEGASAESDEVEALPTVCPICRRPLVDSVMTTCLHYYCEFCALMYLDGENMICFVCNQPSDGILDAPSEVFKRFASEKISLRALRSRK